MNDERNELNQAHGYAPAELKFYAMHKGKRVKDGDYWLPEGRATPSDCYPVRVSSLGIHYTQRLATDCDYIEHSDGRTYYGSWELEAIHTQDVTIYLHNALPGATQTSNNQAPTINERSRRSAVAPR